MNFLRAFLAIIITFIVVFGVIIAWDSFVSYFILPSSELPGREETLSEEEEFLREVENRNLD